jgi:hypothetical protein
MNRRTFLSQVAGTALGAAGAGPAVSFGSPEPATIDFRYAPGQWQTTFCFPDDHFKSLLGNRGELLYGNLGLRNAEYFPTVVEFSLVGMQADRITRQELESPGVPIVHTRIDRPDAFLELTTFASNRSGEGRVDNVRGVMIRPHSSRRVQATPLLTVRTREELTIQISQSLHLAFLGKRLLMAANRPILRRDAGWGWLLSLNSSDAAVNQPLEFWIRLPQENQQTARIAGGFAHPESLLEETREWWRNWRAFGGEIDWKLPGVYQQFLTACARNIHQAREIRDGKLTFQVGPTCYRGLWVVDGNFILEAARYLGLDAEAAQGLESTWAYQQPSGAVQAGAGKEHWKDTAIAMFTLARQCELMQDWSALNRFQSNVVHGVEYLRQIRDRARQEEGPLGRYGLLAKGFGDGGLRLGHELTNTVWALAGLKAISETGRARRIDDFEPAAELYAGLRRAFDAAARQEMRRHPAGFEFLPMLLKDDPQWNVPDPRQRPRPQSAQWALSHAIYPGLVFAKDDPIVKGHISLMQACTQEDVPIETGWLRWEGLWTYNAPFVSHVYLWAGAPDWARSTFHGFLNHASPLYCWREEQPLQNSLAAGYVGDMPHNWASAECILYLRHMLALEDGAALRLLEGIGDPELSSGEPFRLQNSPTRFGRIRLALEPAGRNRWRLEFERAAGSAPGSIELPAQLGSRLRFSSAAGAGSRAEGNRVFISPQARQWSALWSN